MTTLTHNPETGWGFAIGKQPYTGFTSRDAAAEALYDLEHGAAISSPPTVDEAPTMLAQIMAMLEDMEHSPTGDHIYDLLLENRIARYVWWRCIDWVLYRLRNGMPVQRLNDEDTVPAAIDARFKAAQHAYRIGGPRPEPFDVRELSNGNLMDRWERTPEQAAALRAENERLFRVLSAIEAAADVPEVEQFTLQPAI